MTIRFFRRNVDRILRDPGGPLGTRLYRAGIQVQNRARQRCPVDTGRLRSSISTTRPIARGGRLMTIRIGSNVRYAIFVHDGTRFMRARPFLREALRDVLG